MTIKFTILSVTCAGESCSVLFMVFIKRLSKLCPHDSVEMFQLSPHSLVQFVKLSLSRVHLLRVYLSLPSNNRDHIDR